MSFFPVFLDSSAIVKLIVSERETDALTEALERWPDRVSSDLARVEVHRALRRTGRPKSAHERADAVLASLVLIRLDEPVLKRAAAFTDRQMRSLDAIQLAAALSIGDDPDALITYDARLARLAQQEGLTVLHPGVQGLIAP
jgi:predicted nucleic acid-binding protein